MAIAVGPWLLENGQLPTTGKSNTQYRCGFPAYIGLQGAWILRVWLAYGLNSGAKSAIFALPAVLAWNLAQGWQRFFMLPLRSSLVMMLAFSFPTLLSAMFEFLSKFSFRRPKTDKNLSKTGGKPSAPGASEVASLQLAENKKNLVEQARAATLAQIAQAGNDEPALIALLLACDFADGRFKAAQMVHSQSGLEQVHAAMRNIDKRVTKLMQNRLDLIAQASQQEQQAQRCIAQVSSLLEQASLISNQVTDLDKLRAACSAFPAAHLEQYNQLRLALENKLLTQTALQRRLLDLLAQLNQEAAADSEVEQSLGQRLSGWQQELDACMAPAEAAALPKNAVTECSRKIQQQRQRWEIKQEQVQKQAQQELQKLERRQQDEASQTAAIEQAADTLALQAEDVAAADEPVSEPESESEFESNPTSAAPVKPGSFEKKVPSLTTAQIIIAIQGMQDALEQGSVQAARKFDRELRAVDIKTVGLNAEQKNKLFQARSDLTYLQGWAKWGGDVSRDELIKAADDLPTLALAPNELAKKVAVLRERWKEMEATSGSASKDLWERFDSACSVAYAPAAAYFQEQAEQRKINFAAAEAVLAELRDSAAQLLQGVPDWKAIAHFCMQAQQHWKKLGHVDRKHKTRLDAEFEAALQLLRLPLEQRRQEEIVAREALIAEVNLLDPLQKSTTEQLRALQERWQAQASSVPLRRKDEQALWEKYRAACDSLFAQRKLASGEADTQRKENLAVKLELCSALEQAADIPGINVNQLLQQTASTWKKTAAVPRAEEAAIEERYQSAVSVLKKRGDSILDQQRQATKILCLKKLSACQALEQMLAAEVNDAEQMAQIAGDWKALEDLPAKLNAVLATRFQAALQALENDDQEYRHLLQKNATNFDSALLHLEILSGIDSPQELSRERLQMQVGVLQNSLKRGAEDQAIGELLQRLLTLPAPLDTARTQRLGKILALSDTF